MNYQPYVHLLDLQCINQTFKIYSNQMLCSAVESCFLKVPRNASVFTSKVEQKNNLLSTVFLTHSQFIKAQFQRLSVDIFISPFQVVKITRFHGFLTSVEII